MSHLEITCFQTGGFKMRITITSGLFQTFQTREIAHTPLLVYYVLLGGVLVVENCKKGPRSQENQLLILEKTFIFYINCLRYRLIALLERVMVHSKILL